MLSLAIQYSQYPTNTRMFIYYQSQKGKTMKIQHKIKAITKLGIGITAITFLLAGCSGGGSSSGGGGGGSVSGVSTPSKVSVVNTN
jgi:hypothetical protein